MLSSCPSVTRCQQVHFSNAILCDRDIDLTIFEAPGTWEETQCVTAFDDVPPNEPADLDKFHREIMNTNRVLRSARAATERARAALAREKEEHA